jgi:hypothetical protein
MAGVGATLFGLIFVVISIRTEVTRAETITAVRQVQDVSSYTALLNPLIISFLAIIPREIINGITVDMSSIGLTNTLIVVRGVVCDPSGW